jgi:hypothetical protein
MHNDTPLTVTRTQWAAGQGFFHTGVLYANGKPFIYVFDCGSKGNTNTPSQKTKTSIKTEIDTFIESLAHYWTPETRPYWGYWRRNHPIHLDAYKRGVKFIGTPFQDEWLSLQTTKPAIDLIYISHFDDDHINGLNYLIQKCNVSEVAIPYASPAERFIYLLNSTSDEYGELQTSDLLNISDFTLQFVANPRAALAQQADEVILRQSENEDNENNIEIHATYNPTTDGYDLNSTSPALSPNKPIWTLFTHTLKGNARKIEQFFKAALINEIRKLETDKQQECDTIEISEAIEDTGSSRKTFQNKETENLDQIDFTDYALLRKLISREYIGAIRTAYRRAVSPSEDLNPTSLILYSGPTYDWQVFSALHSYWRGDKTLNKYPSAYKLNLAHISPACGWIGCGDAPIGRSPKSIEEFNSIFAHYKTKTRTFAPPHHGSERDWSDKLLDGFGPSGQEAPICVFSANSLRWRHPSTKAILSANSIGSPTIVVTNDTRSRFTETIEMIVRFD